MIEFTIDLNGHRVRKRGPLLILAGGQRYYYCAPRIYGEPQP